ncbi:SAM-dependent methyltransferase [Nonomuraea sp. NPDC000554]|uniref:SAM-dependent methyltransferase n=1 Tax=Nonomuraea sp. NPDC000554 TaxID=3154259 RepID=UPI003331B9C4
MPEFDSHTPNLARMYDYLLGGKDNFAIDREAIDTLAELLPEAVPVARANRAFLQRAVRYLTGTGIRQFLHLGGGLPTQGNAHEVALGSRVVYVERDPVVAAHGRALLEAGDGAVMLEADLLDTDDVLGRAAGFLDLSQPVGLLLVSVLHFVLDEPHAMVARLRDAVAPGSHLVLTHATSLVRAQGPGTLGVHRGPGGTDRTPQEIREFFGDFTMVSPGLVQAADWRPDRPRLVGRPSPASCLLAGVAQKAAKPQ